MKKNNVKGIVIPYYVYNVNFRISFRQIFVILLKAVVLASNYSSDYKAFFLVLTESTSVLHDRNKNILSKCKVIL